jgi:hypothetical protein
MSLSASDRHLHTVVFAIVLVLAAGIAGVGPVIEETQTATPASATPTDTPAVPTETTDGPTRLLDGTPTATARPTRTPTPDYDSSGRAVARTETNRTSDGEPGGDPSDDTTGGVTSSTPADAQATGQLMQATDILPGDRGLDNRTVTNVLDRTATLDIHNVTVTSSENGILEPEEKAGDTTATEGELDERLLVYLFVRRPDGTTEQLAGTADAFVPVETLDDATYTGVATLAANESATIEAAWRLPDDTGNEIQTDGVSVSMTVVLET